MFKTCLDCRSEKRAAEFNRNRRKVDGLDIYCKACCALRQATSWAKRRARDPGYSTRKSQESRKRDPQAVADYQKAWLLANPEKVRSYRKKDYWTHREQRLAEDKARREANIDLFLARERASLAKRYDAKLAATKAWQKANPHKVARAAADRRANLLQRTPLWLTEADYAEIDLIYLCAQTCTAVTGKPHHVDHIYPLKGRYVSGLHVPSNLQVLTGTENMKKSNVWVPE